MIVAVVAISTYMYVHLYLHSYIRSGLTVRFPHNILYARSEKYKQIKHPLLKSHVSFSFLHRIAIRHQSYVNQHVLQHAPDSLRHSALDPGLVDSASQ